MPILTAEHVTTEKNNVNSPLTVTKCKELGCWASSICVNAQTTDLHTEKLPLPNKTKVVVCMNSIFV